MALTYQEINAYTNKWILPKSQELIFKRSPMFVRLMSKHMERYEGGLFIQHPLIFGELTGGPITKGSTFDISYVNTDTAMSLYMKTYYLNISLYGLDDLLNRGPMAAFSQVESKFLNASLSFAKMLATDMYLDGGNTRASGTNTSDVNRVDGFQAWYDDGNLYTAIAGITRADLATAGTISGLNAYTNTSFNAFSLTGINTAYGKAFFGADHVDLIITPQTGWDRFWNAIQPMQRYMDTNSDVGKIGFQTFRFNGAEVVVDQYMPASTMFGFNTNYITLWASSNPRFNFGFTGFKEAPNTIDVAGQFLWSGNLMVTNPRTGFKLSGTGLA